MVELRLSDAALDYVDGLERAKARAESALEDARALIKGLESELREERTGGTPSEALVTAIANALENLAGVNGMQGVAVTNQAAAQRVLNEALRKYHTRGPRLPQ